MKVSIAAKRSIPFPRIISGLGYANENRCPDTASRSSKQKPGSAIAVEDEKIV
jgi:hypothetical protein